MPQPRPTPTRLACLAALIAGLAGPSASAQLEREGAIGRGPTDGRRLALVFTGHEFAEGGDAILDALAKHNARASFFLTGDFLANPGFEPIVRRITDEGHYLGPHSDKHLLYCDWDDPDKTL